MAQGEHGLAIALTLWVLAGKLGGLEANAAREMFADQRTRSLPAVGRQLDFFAVGGSS